MSGTLSNPAIVGIFYTDKTFSTGVGTNPFTVLGSVVAMQGAELQRDLGDAQNSTDPSEIFVLSPELPINYPAALTFKHPTWTEIAP